jgi:hypothetical protein
VNRFSLAMMAAAGVFSHPTTLSVAATLETTAPQNLSPSPAPVGTIFLREVVEQGLLGIQKEPETLLKVREKARNLADLWRGQLSKKDEAAWRAKCGENFESDDFCPILLGMTAQEALEKPEVQELKDGDLDLSETESAPASVAEVVAHLKKAELSPLSSVTSPQIYSALRRIKKSDELRGAVEEALNRGDSYHCKNPLVATALGQKLETFFPHPILKEKMYWLYGKVLKCTGTSEILDRARFRAAVHRIQDKKCDQAIPLLNGLYATGNLEYTSRSLYWKARCAQSAGDNLQYSALQQKLIKESPLSYHSIVLNRNEVARLSRILSNEEPKVLLRSHENPKMNAWIRVVEGLISVGSIDFARKVLVKSLSGFLKVEPELRLYLSFLAGKVKDPISEFRIVATIFKEKPELMSQNTLKLFYPLKNFQTIQNNAADLDPYFVAALIRQESGFNPSAHSRVGAVGLMQLMPATARALENVSRQALWNPNTNIRLGTRYIHRLVNHYDLDAELALAAYNAGKNIVDLWRKRYVDYDRMAFLDLIPYKETRDYVVLISRNYFWYHKLYGDLLGRPVRSGGSMPFVRREVATSEESVARAIAPKPLVFTLFQ